MLASVAPMMGTVLAVVVAYQRGLGAVEPWPALRELLSRHATGAGELSLRHVLIYDNSAVSRIRPEELPDGARLVHDPRNGGTVAGFEEAVRQARAECIDWILMLDHDTQLPADFLARADECLRATDSARIGAVLPRIRHGNTPISPSRLTWSGSIRPLAPDEAPRPDDRLSGIASGALVRVAALARIAPVPPTFWLDYFDHWLFLQLRGAGQRLAISQARLMHDLSVVDIATMSQRRLQSMLAGEAEFARLLPLPARLVRPFRLVLRALRFGRAERSHFITVLRALRPTAGKRAP